MSELKVLTLTGGPLGANTYLVQLPDETLLIDPAAPPQDLPADWPSIGRILVTHGHIDHIAAADAWRDKSPAPLAIHAAEKAALEDASVNLSRLLGMPQTFRAAKTFLCGDETFDLGRGFQLQVWSTPGHSPGSCCFWITRDDLPQALFSGDTLFAGSVGRCDLPGGDADTLTRSLLWLRQKLNRADRLDIPIHPGHGPATTWRQEAATNPYLKE